MDSMTRIDPKNLTEEEKLKLRQQRFNSDSNFNTINAIRLVEEEKRKILERQKKFGVIVEIPEIEQEKIKKRRERFGIVEKDNESEKLKKRAERFNITSESDKLKNRAERFKHEFDQTSITKETNNPSRRIKNDRRKRKIKNWKKLRPNQPKRQRDRRGPKRLLGFKRLGKRNKINKKFT